LVLFTLVAVVVALNRAAQAVRVEMVVAGLVLLTRQAHQILALPIRVVVVVVLGILHQVVLEVLVSLLFATQTLMPTLQPLAVD
jgi:hypothetical protein